MIQIHARRAGLLCIAVTVDDNREPTASWGFTSEGASRRLLRHLDKAVSA